MTKGLTQLICQACSKYLEAYVDDMVELEAGAFTILCGDDKCTQLFWPEKEE